MDEIEIDQTFRRRESSHDAKACFAERGNHHKEPALIGAPDAGDAVFSHRSRSIDIEWIVFNDLLGLFGGNLVAVDVILH